MSKTASTATVRPGEALKNKKKQESNKNLLIWGIIGVGVLINFAIIYKNNVAIQYELKDAGAGHFVADFQNEFTDNMKACNDIAS